MGPIPVILFPLFWDKGLCIKVCVNAPMYYTQVPLYKGNHNGKPGGVENHCFKVNNNFIPFSKVF